MYTEYKSVVEDGKCVCDNMYALSEDGYMDVIDLGVHFVHPKLIT